MFFLQLFLIGLESVSLEAAFLQKAAHVLLVVAFNEHLSLKFVYLRHDFVILVLVLGQTILDVLSQILIKFLEIIDVIK